MRQVMPHRSNIYVRRTNCKIFFAARGSGGLGWLATGRFAALRTPSTGAAAFQYNHTKQWFMRSAGGGCPG